MKVYLDGRVIDESEASIGVFDAAVQHGVGLFETMRAYNGRVYRLGQHVDRLVHSAATLGLTDQLHAGPLCEAVQLVVSRNEITEARIRLTVTGGNLALLASAQGRKQPKHQPTVLITASEPTQYPESFLVDGVSVTIADPKANPFDPLAGHKSIQYWQRLSALMAAAAAKAGESLWFTVTNHLCGGSVSNAFVVKDGQLHTPIARGEEPDGAIPSACLPGVTRAAVIELAEKLDLPVHRKMLTINDVLEADELFLTNSSWLLLPVVKVEKESIGDGKPGPIGASIYKRLLESIAAECGVASDAPAEG